MDPLEERLDEDLDDGIDAEDPFCVTRDVAVGVRHRFPADTAQRDLAYGICFGVLHLPFTGLLVTHIRPSVPNPTTYAVPRTSTYWVA